jgi:hypothetical protein
VIYSSSNHHLTSGSSILCFLFAFPYRIPSFDTIFFFRFFVCYRPSAQVALIHHSLIHQLLPPPTTLRPSTTKARMLPQITVLLAALATLAVAIPLNVNLGAYSPALVVGDGAISFE